MRPIHHFKEHSIKAHILICFMALAIAKYIEIKSKKSIRAVTKILKKVTDAKILDKTNGREIFMRSEVDEETREIIELVLSH